MLQSCPFLQTYGNVTYKIPKSISAAGDTNIQEAEDTTSQSVDPRYYATSDFGTAAKVITHSPGHFVCVIPVLHIDGPD